jgi:hypothetical protein
MTHLRRHNLEIPPEQSQVEHWTDLHKRTTVRKGRIIKKNGREQQKQHKVSYYVILINNVPTTLSRTLYYKNEINK